MIGLLKSVSDRLLGRGGAALTVPPLDGALKPNNRLEDAPAGLPARQPGALALRQGQVLWAEGDALMSPSGEQARMPGPITAMAASPSGSSPWPSTAAASTSRAGHRRPWPRCPA